jgi:predicted glycosyltransferase
MRILIDISHPAHAHFFKNAITDFKKRGYVVKPDESILREYGISKDEKYFIVRFVGWNALHDCSEKGFNLDSKHNLVEKLSNYGCVIITSEESLPHDLEKYRSKIPIDKIHDVMAFASLVIGESATMASEAAVLGVPAIFISTTGCGHTDEQDQQKRFLERKTRSV